MELRRTVSHGVMQAIIGMGTQKVISIGLNRWAKRYNQKQLEAALRDVEVRPERYGLGLGDDVAKGGTKTNPSKIPSVNAKPRGSKTVISEADDAITKRSLMRENESAEALAKNGYDVEQNPVVQGTTKKPDYLIEEKIFDCYSPSTNNSRNIASNIEKKIIDEQSERIVLNLTDSSVSLNDLRKQLSEYPIKGLKEVIVIRNNQVIDFFPF